MIINMDILLIDNYFCVCVSVFFFSVSAFNFSIDSFWNAAFVQFSLKLKHSQYEREQQTSAPSLCMQTVNYLQMNYKKKIK